MLFFVLVSVTLVETIDAVGFLLKLQVIGIERMILGIHLAFEYPILGVHRAAGGKLRSIAQYDRYFVVFRMNSFLHGIDKN